MAAERLLAAAHRWREGVATEAVVAPPSEAAPQLEPLELTILGCTSDSEGATLPPSLGAVCSAWTSQHLLPASERMFPNRALRPVLRYWAHHTDAQWLEELQRSSDRCVVRLPLTHSYSIRILSHMSHAHSSSISPSSSLCSAQPYVLLPWLVYDYATSSAAHCRWVGLARRLAAGGARPAADLLGAAYISHKKYLLDLLQDGIPAVPTRLVAEGSDARVVEMALAHAAAASEATSEGCWYESLSWPRCHTPDVTPQMSHPRCHTSDVTLQMSHSRCHTPDVTPQMSQEPPLVTHPIRPSLLCPAYTERLRRTQPAHKHSPT